MHGRVRKPKLELESKAYKEDQGRRIAEYRKSLDLVFTERRNLECTEEALKHSLELLELNPEINTVWNYRRTILLELFSLMDDIEKQEKLEEELAFINVAIKKNIKSYWMWNHRQWILATMPSPDWQKEAQLVDILLHIDATNFHGWDYRRYVISRMGESVDRDEITKKEFAYSKEKIKQNFANHSAWHYRSKLFPDIIRISGDKSLEKIIKKETDMIKKAIYSDPDDQNAWLYFDWLLQFNANENEMREKGIEIAHELLELEPNSKYALQALINYSIQVSESGALDPETRKLCVSYISRLKEIDPLRKNKYSDLEKLIYSKC